MTEEDFQQAEEFLNTLTKEQQEKAAKMLLAAMKSEALLWQHVDSHEGEEYYGGICAEWRKIAVSRLDHL